MKIRISNERASTLMITLVTVVIIGVTMASYLDLISAQNRSTMRSQQWNLAIPVLESGIEEALTHLNYNSTNLGTEGWTLVDGLYQKERELGESKYVVTISQDAQPVIISRAYVREPLGTNYLDPPRAVKVTVTNTPLFAKGMVAKGQIDLNGNNIKTDSFDSSDPTYSTGGLYDSSKTKDNGDVATNSGLINSLNVGNADVYGHVSTGPGGSVEVGSNGSVGSASWHSGGNHGIEPGYSTDDMNVQFPDVKAPWTGGAYTPTGGTVDGTSYTYVLTSGNWELSSLSMSGKSGMLVTGDAVLYVTGSVSMSGNASITVATNASLQMYVGGASASLGGNGVVNAAGNATNFYYYGLPSNTSLSMTGNGEFTGVIYAPEAAFSLNGGGSGDQDFVGASISSTVQMNGHFKFHYDENLSKVGPSRGFTVDSWNEVFSYDEL